MHALFDKNLAKNHWSISAHILRAFSEYFGAKTEQLDMYSEGGRFTFTSYTEKLMNGNGVQSSHNLGPEKGLMMARNIEAAIANLDRY